jgi:uncharacterized membrane protein YhaH (DUF805 family)
MRDFMSKWFLFKGRIGRRRYWSLTLLYVLAFAVGLASIGALGIVLDVGPSDTILIVLVPLAIVFVLSMSVALTDIGVRRLHDRGKSGSWLLLYYALPSWMTRNADLDAVGLVVSLAILGILIWAIVDLGVLRGDPGSNAYGPNPLAEKPAPHPAE